jgi:hypothetical protein
MLCPELLMCVMASSDILTQVVCRILPPEGYE